MNLPRSEQGLWVRQSFAYCEDWNKHPLAIEISTAEAASSLADVFVPPILPERCTCWLRSHSSGAVPGWRLWYWASPWLLTCCHLQARSAQRPTWNAGLGWPPGYPGPSWQPTTKEAMLLTLESVAEDQATTPTIFLVSLCKPTSGAWV